MKNRSTLNVMYRLIGLVKPLSFVMSIAIIMGCLGYFCATFITVFAGYAVLDLISNGSSLNMFIMIIGCIAIMRGILHYIEQYCNHYIAFKLLALIRDKVFHALRRLAPAKLDTKDKGNLVSIITSDIELLEVFYAHTVSPICIAIITSSFIICLIGRYSIVLGAIALFAHFTIGVLIPIIVSKKSKSIGENYREKNGELNSYFLDSLRGLKEILQYNHVKERKSNFDSLSLKMEASNKEIKDYMGKTMSLTNLMILSFSIVMLFTSSALYLNQSIELEAVIIPTILLISSFGAVTSISNLGVGLSQTIASGNRVLDILDETAIVEEKVNGVDVDFEGANFNEVSFSYGNEDILNQFSMTISKNEILGISGKSGCGKSTLLKLLMRYWDTKSGEVLISNRNIKEINTKSLRSIESLVMQQTHIFHDTIIENIKIAKLDATHEEVVKASKKASIHDFICSLPNGYQTQVGELGDTISGGEMQRIGLARAFLCEADLILLDEPTSNLDSLNEAIILKSLKETKNKTLVLVSHRTSTMKIANRVVNMEATRKS